MSTNTAAWLTAEKSRPFEVKEAPYWEPKEHEILVKSHAVAIQPIDGIMQAFAVFPLQYPTILGMDVAGEVVAIGSEVSRFSKGDRVIGQATGMTSGRLCETAFQSYCILQSHMASEIPDGMPYENAAVLPCGLSTAACGLFQEAPFLQLQYPTEPVQKPTGKTVLVWGGSSSVGSNGIQLAVAAGYEVIATASPKNFEYVKSLGAMDVYDYCSSTIVDDLVSACQGRTMAGALDCVGAVDMCMDVMQKVEGNRAVVSTKPDPVEARDGVTFGGIFGSTLTQNAVGPAIYVDFLPKALKAGSFLAAPEPQIVGTGLDHVQEAVDLVMKGVSAKKLVVKL